MKNLVIVCLVVLSVNSALGVININDGLEHDITTTFIDKVYVDYGAPGVGTTLNVLDGGNFNSTLRGYGNSYINVDGGFVHDLWVRDNSQLDFISGSIGVAIRCFDNSIATINNVTGNGFFSTEGTSKATINGGSFGLIQTLQNSAVDFYDGTIAKYFDVNSNSTVNIYGGLFGTNNVIRGFDFITHDTSTLTIFGSDFNYPYGEINISSGTLTGVLASGDIVNNTFLIEAQSKIILAPVPEPMTMMILGLGGLVLRKRRA